MVVAPAAIAALDDLGQKSRSVRVASSRRELDVVEVSLGRA